METIIRLEEKLDKVLDQLSLMNGTLSAQQIILDEHVRRTDLLEKQVDVIRIKSAWVEGAMKLGGAVLFILSSLAGLYSIIGKK